MFWTKMLRANLRDRNSEIAGMTVDELAQMLPINQDR